MTLNASRREFLKRASALSIAGAGTPLALNLAALGNAAAANAEGYKALVCVYLAGGNDYAKGILHKYALPETAPEATGQLFDLAKDPGETKNLLFEEVGKRQELQALLARLTAKEGGRTAPVERVPLGIERIPRRNEVR